MTYSLYVLEDGTKSKIGITKRALEKRLKEYDTHNPHWKLHYSVDVSDESDLRRVEGAVKAFYKPYKIQNRGDEWFDISASKITNLVCQLVAHINQVSSSHIRSFHHIPVSKAAGKLLCSLDDTLNTELGRKSEKELEAIQKKRDDNKASMRREFASAFDLGISSYELESISRVVKKDFGAPDLSKVLDSSATELTEAIFWGCGYIQPPYKDHEERFYVLAPLESGSAVAFCSALVLMPYSNFDDDWMSKVKEIKRYADIVGWTCTEHSEWSWYYPGKTGLVVLQPKTPMHDILHMFASSFRKFVIERVKLYELESLPRLSEVVNLIANNACFPLNVNNFDDLYSSYIRKFCRMEYDFTDEDDVALVKAYKYLFSEWKNEH